MSNPDYAGPYWQDQRGAGSGDGAPGDRGRDDPYWRGSGAPMAGGPEGGYPRPGGYDRAGGQDQGRGYGPGPGGARNARAPRGRGTRQRGSDGAVPGSEDYRLKPAPDAGRGLAAGARTGNRLMAGAGERPADMTSSARRTAAVPAAARTATARRPRAAGRTATAGRTAMTRPTATARRTAPTAGRTATARPTATAGRTAMAPRTAAAARTATAARTAAPPRGCGSVPSSGNAWRGSALVLATAAAAAQAMAAAATAGPAGPRASWWRHWSWRKVLGLAAAACAVVMIAVVIGVVICLRGRPRFPRDVPRRRCSSRRSSTSPTARTRWGRSARASNRQMLTSAQIPR